MKQNENLKDIFTILHDGTIEEAVLKSDNLELKIKIEYLAQLVDSSYNLFELTLLNVESLFFKPWTGPTNELTDYRQIFDLDLTITSTQLDDEGRIAVHVTCGKPIDNSYEGGELVIDCQGYLIFDQQKKSLSLDKLKHHSANYWNNSFGT